MSEIKTKIRTYNDVIDLFGEEKAADMLSEAHDRQPVVRQSGTVTAKPARPVCRYRTRGKCLEQPA